MRTLYFSNPVFNSQLNLTTRRGIKWNIESTASICDLNDNEYGQANFRYTKVLRFCDITDEDLIAEHDPKCRTVSGLYEEMKTLYPSFDERELVTLVYFEVSK